MIIFKEHTFFFFRSIVGFVPHQSCEYTDMIFSYSICDVPTGFFHLLHANVYIFFGQVKIFPWRFKIRYSFDLRVIGLYNWSSFKNSFFLFIKLFFHYTGATVKLSCDIGMCINVLMLNTNICNKTTYFNKKYNANRYKKLVI